MDVIVWWRGQMVMMTMMTMMTMMRMMLIDCDTVVVTDSITLQ